MSIILPFKTNNRSMYVHPYIVILEYNQIILNKYNVKNVRKKIWMKFVFIGLAHKRGRNKAGNWPKLAAMTQNAPNFYLHLVRMSNGDISQQE